MFDLRNARRDKGLLLRQAAGEFGISESYLSLIERRNVVPRAPIALKIASFYDKRVSEIWPNEPERGAA